MADLEILTDEEITMVSHHLSIEEVQYAYEPLPQHFVSGYVEFARAIEAAVLEKMKQQEPVGTPATYIFGSDDCTMAAFDAKEVPVGTRLYTHPAPVQQEQTDQSVTPEYLEWLASIQPRHGVGGNEAWNAGAKWMFDNILALPQIKGNLFAEKAIRALKEKHNDN